MSRPCPYGSDDATWGDRLGWLALLFINLIGMVLDWLSHNLH